MALLGKTQSNIGGDEMKFKIGEPVRIVSDYPFDRTLQSATGNIVALPSDEHQNEYLVKLDGGITRSLYLEGKITEVSPDYLESA